MDSEKTHCKAIIEYPCVWVYKIIGTDSEALKREISELLHEYQYRLEESRTSRTGKYSSFNLTVVVESEKVRISLYRLLKENTLVQYVL